MFHSTSCPELSGPRVRVSSNAPSTPFPPWIATAPALPAWSFQKAALLGMWNHKGHWFLVRGVLYRGYERLSQTAVPKIEGGGMGSGTLFMRRMLVQRNCREEKGYFGDCKCHQGTSRMSVLSAVCLNERQWVLVMGKLGSLMRNAKVIEFI